MKNKRKNTNLKDPAFFTLDLTKPIEPFQDPEKSQIVSEVTQKLVSFCKVSPTKSARLSKIIKNLVDFLEVSQSDLFKYGYDDTIRDPITKKFFGIKKFTKALNSYIKRINELLELLKPPEAKKKQQKAFYTRLFKASPNALIEAIDIKILPIVRINYHPPYEGGEGKARKKKDIEKCWEIISKIERDIPNPKLKKIDVESTIYNSPTKIAIYLAASLYSCKYSEIRDMYTKAKKAKRGRSGPD